MWARAIGRLAFSKRNYKGQKNMAGWADGSLRVMFMKKIGIFVYRSFCVIPFFPREWFRNYNVQEKCCRNELSLPSFNFCLNDMVTVTIVSAKFPALWYVIYAALFLKLQNFKKTFKFRFLSFSFIYSQVFLFPCWFKIGISDFEKLPIRHTDVVSSAVFEIPVSQLLRVIIMHTGSTKFVGN